MTVDEPTANGDVEQKEAVPSLDDLFKALARSDETVSSEQPLRGVASNQAESAQIRQWARDNGYQVAPRGRLPDHVVDAYKRRPSSTSARRPTRTSRSSKSVATPRSPALPYLSSLQEALIAGGVKCQLNTAASALIISAPHHVKMITSGKIEAFVSNGDFVWGDGRFLSIHPIEDHEGAARKILRSSTPVPTPSASPVPTPSASLKKQSEKPVIADDSEGLERLLQLRDALAVRGVRADFDPYKALLVIRSPTEVATITDGYVQVLRCPDLRFSWGKGLPRVSHIAEDPDGAAWKITRGGSKAATPFSTSTHEQSSISRPRPERPPRLGGRAITTYSSDELVTLVRWLISEERATTYDDLVDNAIAELRLPGRTSRRVQAIEEAAILAGWASGPNSTTDGAQYSDVLRWARRLRFELDTSGEIPEHVVYQYNRMHPERPYNPVRRRGR
ncbi:histone-like nucleoid-structuring protein Lsr2 [Nonomuraea sp. NPDC049480]|uniref:Lsr2 family DNA-binding protein n=1 Tax=Nonomuraea sp. NPDC049480 TaxID=3364353 RepID=UPI00378E35C5